MIFFFFYSVLIGLLLQFSLEFLYFSTDCFDNATLKVTNSDFTQKLWFRAALGPLGMCPVCPCGNPPLPVNNATCANSCTRLSVSYRPSKSQNKIWGTMKTGTQRYDLNRCNVRNNEVTTSKGKKCTSIDIMKSYMCEAH